MSHFCVIVTGENVEDQLQPFHEFECTGEDDQYVQDIDRTEEVRAEYESKLRSMLRGPDGELVERYDDRFHRDPTPEEQEKIGPFAGTGVGHGMSWTSKDWEDGRGYRTKVHFVPEGWEEVEVPYRDTMSFAEFVTYWTGKVVIREGEILPANGDERKYGYALADANGEVLKVIDRTNPNAKWDWWVVGGRWTGFFRLKPGAQGKIGEPGIMTTEAPLGSADSALVEDIDWDYMRDIEGETALMRYDRIRAILDRNPGFKRWETMRAEFPDSIDDARTAYHAQPAVKELHDLGEYFVNLEDFTISREEFEANARAQAGVPFALLHEGRWVERGEMGWWGMVANEQERDDWNKQVQDVLTSLPPGTRLTLVDCHI